MEKILESPFIFASYFWRQKKVQFIFEMDSQASEALDATPIGKKKPRTCPHCRRHFRRFEHLQRHIRIRMLLDDREFAWY